MKDAGKTILTVVVVAIIAALCFSILYFAITEKEICEQSGGAYVRGMTRYECVSKVR